MALLGLLALTPGLRAQTTEDVDRQLNLRFANGIAAIAEGKVITVDDIRREIAPLIPQIQRESRNEQEFNQRLETLQDDIIQQLVDRVLIVKEFYKDEKRRIPASFVDNAVAENLITQFEGDRSKFLAYLRSRGLTRLEYRREVEEDIIYSYMRGQQRKSANVVSPVRVETFYNENKERFYQEDGVHLRLIQFTRKNGESDEQLLQKARQVKARLAAGEKFDDIARDVSDDARRARGGDWGWQKRSDLKPEFSEPLFTLKEGEATEPILLGDQGCFVLFAEERRYAGIQPLEDVREDIERILQQQMTRQSQERWLERLRRNGYVKLY
ncbi:MAG TPA: peptidyl-prolyl cis-trans isomerase [Candidatus Synoicihabitans sp.]|nr:peptidyl-prolyl cis-trans isomerase [Candidatus Synoicihabitans sp.]